jgi:hypothetical protein
MKVFVDEGQVQGITFIDPVTKKVTPCVTPKHLGLSWRQYDGKGSCEKWWQMLHGILERPIHFVNKETMGWFLESNAMLAVGLIYDSPLTPDLLRNRDGDPIDYDYRNGGFVKHILAECKAYAVSKIMKYAIGYHNYTVSVKASSGTVHMKRGRTLGVYKEEHFKKEVVRKSKGKPVEMKTEGLPKKKHRTTQQSKETTFAAVSLEVSDLRRQLEASNAEIERLKQAALQPMESIDIETGLKVR